MNSRTAVAGKNGPPKIVRSLVVVTVGVDVAAVVAVVAVGAFVVVVGGGVVAVGCVDGVKNNLSVGGLFPMTIKKCTKALNM